MRYRSIPVLLLAMAASVEVRCETPAQWQRADAAALDAMRGGFTAPGGLAVSLGIERQVTINGEVVARTTFQIANVRAITPDEARQAHAALTSATLVQNGASNAVVGAGLAGGGTFVQNTLDGQSINSQTIISASVNSASLLKEMQFQAGMRDAGIRAIGTH